MMVKDNKNVEKKEKIEKKQADNVCSDKCKKNGFCSFLKFILFFFILLILIGIFLNKKYLPIELQKYIPEMTFTQNGNQDVKKIEADVSALNEKIASLELKLSQQNNDQKIIEIENKLLVNSKLSENIADNNKRLLSLNDDVKKSLNETSLLKEDVKQVRASSAPASVVLSMVGRIDTNEAKIKNISKQSEDGALIIMGTILIKDAIERGDNYFMEAEILKEISKNNKDVSLEVKTLLEYSNKNIIKRDALIKRFNDCADDAVSMSEMKDDNNWKGRVYNKFKSLVKVRKTDVDSEEDMSVEAVLARAERYIDQGQIGKAVKEVEKIGQDSHIIKKSGFEAWLLKATDRVKVEKAISNILAKSLAVIKVNHLK